MIKSSNCTNCEFTIAIVFIFIFILENIWWKETREFENLLAAMQIYSRSVTNTVWWQAFRDSAEVSTAGPLTIQVVTLPNWI